MNIVHLVVVKNSFYNSESGRTIQKSAHFSLILGTKNLVNIGTQHLDAWTSTPFTTSSHIPPAFPRDQSDAVVLPPLTRRNAFRLPNNNHTFVCTPPTSSRIPLPISPNNVVLDRVNDMSQVLPLNDRSVPRRSTRVSRAPQFLGVPQSQTQWREEE